MVVSGNNIIAGASFDGVNPSGVYVSNDNGQTWALRNEGLNMDGFEIETMLIANGNIYMGGLKSGQNFDSVWIRPLSQVIGIKKISSNVPDKFSLSQNYPNPFNPSTKIKFNVPPFEGRQEGRIVLKVYDVLGNEITTLVNEKLQPGTYEVPFSINQFPDYQMPSGVYFYKLTTNGFSETKKMIILK